MKIWNIQFISKIVSHNINVALSDKVYPKFEWIMTLQYEFVKCCKLSNYRFKKANYVVIKLLASDDSGCTTVQM